jgi:hypothetical protein
VGGARADLDADEERLRALREGATKLLGWLAAPRPPIDPVRLAQGIAEAERGEVERGPGIPPMPALLRLAKAKGVPVERFAEGVDDLAGNEAEQAPEEPSRARKGGTP